jgi:flagellar basal body rod protein FlgG
MAVALLANLPFDQTSIIQSGDEFDVAIVGHGFFSLTDLNSGDIRYTRCGNFQINEYGQLAMVIRGRMWTVEPGVTIPSDWERIGIQHDGRVQVFEYDSWIDVGQLQLTRFARTPTFANPIQANLATDELGTSLTGSPGEGGFGVIHQGWSERPTTTYLQLTIHLLIGFLVSLSINALIVRSRTQDSERSRPEV